MSPAAVDRNIIWVGSPNFGYGRGVHGQNHAKALVWHITGSAPNVPPLDPLSGLDGWFQNLLAGSTQFGIQDKAIHQYVRLADAAWGNGLMREPDLRNDIIKRWWDLGINPNVETWSVEVVAEAGPNNVQVGEHRVNQDTWDSMGWLGANLATESPIDEFVVFQWQGHYMIDSLSRARDPITIYRPDDVRREVVTLLHPDDQEDDDMINRDAKLFHTWNPAKLWCIDYIEGIPMYRRWITTQEAAAHLTSKLGPAENIDIMLLASIPELRPSV